MKVGRDGFDIIEVPNTRAIRLGDNPPDAFYVVLPMQDITYLDSIIRVKNKKIAWRYVADEHSQVFGLDPSDGNGEKFFEYIKEYCFEDFDFFIWHPEVLKGKYYKG